VLPDTDHPKMENVAKNNSNLDISSKKFWKI